MAEGKRPGGLTALAVINFVFGGLGALGLLALFALLSAANDIAKGAGASIHDAPGAGMVYLGLLLGVLSVVLLITSGVGYLGQKKFLGRTLGNAYAVLALGGRALDLAVYHSGVGLFFIIGMIYPVLTLILLNTTFKDDLVN